ncbi:MAG: hypothetical protein D4R38_02690 [Dehalococcoidia bacterium]|nr:MAG: hypothetical protein D4R38_02690 [Dehalococcoidia bacterium]
MTLSTLDRQVRSILRTFKNFTAKGGGVQMRKYQLEPAAAILESVRLNKGLDIVVVMPRQAGKDELLAHLKIYLMRLLHSKDRGIVEVNPTYKPQTISAILRLENRLNSNLLTLKRWKKRSDYIRMIGSCRTAFLSGDGQANVVGATADLLMIVNEAQDISPAIYDRKFAPMASSRNATRVFSGTVWTSNTLLAQMTRTARLAEQADGIRRVFFYTAKDVRKENKKYGRYVDAQVARLGRNHPLIRTQYFCEEIDAQAGMFNPARRALMQGDQPGHPSPVPGRSYAFLIDVAGQDEARMSYEDDNAPLTNTGRDSTTLSIATIDLTSLDTLQAPTYRTIHRQSWIGSNHLTVFGALRALGDAWQPQHIVIDATGVGEGLYAMLDRAFPTRVIPVKFTQQQKSEIGWRFLAIIETGRFRDCALTDAVRAQYDACVSEILPGPAKTLRWSVPEGTRGQDGELIHDDYLLADALVAILDEMDWQITSPSVIVPAQDPLTNMDRNF